MISLTSNDVVAVGWFPLPSVWSTLATGLCKQELIWRRSKADSLLEQIQCNWKQIAQQAAINYEKFIIKLRITSRSSSVCCGFSLEVLMTLAYALYSGVARSVYRVWLLCTTLCIGGIPYLCFL
jgi:hypothetical protein